MHERPNAIRRSISGGISPRDPTSRIVVTFLGVALFQSHPGLGGLPVFGEFLRFPDIFRRSIPHVGAEGRPRIRLDRPRPTTTKGRCDMKTNSVIPPFLVLLLTLGLGPANRARADGEASSPASVTATENLGFDLVDGKSNKIARVHSMTPVSVFVIYEGGKAGRKIPRQELSPELRSKYPYDAAKAAEYQRQQAEAVASQVAAQQAAQRVMAQSRENAIKAEIEKLEAEDRRLQGPIELYAGMAPGNGRKKHLADLRNERQHGRERILKLEEQLKMLQTRRDGRM